VELIDDLLRDLALDRKYICDIAIVMLSPKVRIVARVDQLRVHPNSPARALDAAFDHMRNAQVFAISRRLRSKPLLYFITLVRLITFRSATLARFVRISSC